jgi:HD superfamily phosphohydrolase
MAKLSATDSAVFKAIQEHFDPNAELVHFYDSGSTARVFHVRLPVGNALDFSVDRIVKVFRHDGGVIGFPDVEKVFRREIRSLISSSSTNVVSIYSAGMLEVESGRSTPFYVMEYLEGAEDFDAWLTVNAINLRRDIVLDLLVQVCRGLQALHDAKVLHCDLKFGNVLIGNGPRLKIADLGFSKELRGGPGDTALHTTLESLPNRYKNFISELHDPRRTLVTIARNTLNESFDLHYLGKLIQKTLLLPAVSSLFDSLEAKSLLLVVERLDLDHEPRLERYTTAKAVAEDLSKLLPAYMNRPGVPELSTYTGTRTIRIPVTGSIPFSKRAQAMISHPLFLRLHSAKQLGFTYFVFPGATHSRFEHSLGVFANVARYINSLLADDYQPFFRQVIDEEKIATVLLAGLIHDIGQHSFAHSLEDVGLAQRHETIARAFITGEGIEDLVPDRYLVGGSVQKLLEHHWPQVNQEQLLWLITGERPKGLSPDVGWEIMRSIISGPLDADKTDYLLRDAHHAGVEYARSIDLLRFMNSLTAAIVKENLKLRGVLAITWKGAQSAENIILARSQMFWVLYWHHAVRSAHGTLAECVAAHLRDADAATHKKFRHTLYCGAVGELLALLEKSRNERANRLATMLRHRQLYKRGIDLDYRDDDQLYNRLLGLKDHFGANGDPLLKNVAQSVAEAANGWLGKARSNTRLNSNDVMVDIPKPTKDKLGAIYVLDRNAEHAKEYTSRAMMGTNEDWQNRVRTIRVFLNPEVEVRDREIIRQHGREILEAL